MRKWLVVAVLTLSGTQVEAATKKEIATETCQRSLEAQLAAPLSSKFRVREYDENYRVNAVKPFVASPAITFDIEARTRGGGFQMVGGRCYFKDGQLDEEWTVICDSRKDHSWSTSIADQCRLKTSSQKPAETEPPPRTGDDKSAAGTTTTTSPQKPAQAVPPRRAGDDKSAAGTTTTTSSQKPAQTEPPRRTGDDKNAAGTKTATSSQSPAQPEPPRRASGFDPDQIAQMLERVRRSPDQATPSGTTPTGGLNAALMQSELISIRKQVQDCWSPPAGAKEAKNDMSVTLRFSLNTDGSLKGSPEIVDKHRLSDDAFRSVAESAVRAVRLCSPLKYLPSDRYERWKDVELILNPREMRG